MDSITVPGLNYKKECFIAISVTKAAISTLILTLSWSLLDIVVFPKELISPISSKF